MTRSLRFGDLTSVVTNLVPLRCPRASIWVSLFLGIGRMDSLLNGLRTPLTFSTLVFKRVVFVCLICLARNIQGQPITG